jgi:hypothetical protein
VPSDGANTVPDVSRLRALTEEECYARCYGMRDDNVTIIRREPKRRRAARVSGEHLRRRFEELLDQRDPNELAEPEAA